MLIKIFGMPFEAQTRTLLDGIVAEVALREQVSVRASFSPIPIRRNNEPGGIRILPLGMDAHGIERRVIQRVGNLCHDYFIEYDIPWPGFEDPQLPGQP